MGGMGVSCADAWGFRSAVDLAAIGPSASARLGVSAPALWPGFPNGRRDGRAGGQYMDVR